LIRASALRSLIALAVLAVIVWNVLSTPAMSQRYAPGPQIQLITGHAVNSHSSPRK
jgi:hypothetical protein